MDRQRIVVAYLGQVGLGIRN